MAAVDTRMTGRGSECSVTESLAPSACIYEMYGLRVRSSLPLPLEPFACSSDLKPEIVICRARDPIEPDGTLTGVVRSPGLGDIARYYRGSAGCWIWNRLVGTLFISPDGSLIRVALDDDANLEALGHLLVGQAVIIALHKRGYPVLHASAVCVARGAIAFLAPSGFGKTTMAAGFVRHGATLLTDDALSLTERIDGFYGQPGVPHMKMWPQTASSFLNHPDDLPDLVTAPEKKLLQFGDRYAFAEHPARVTAMYVLRRYDPRHTQRADITVRNLVGHEGIAALLAHTSHRVTLLPADCARLLPIYARLLTRASVKVLSYPEGAEYQHAVYGRLLADLGDNR